MARRAETAFEVVTTGVPVAIDAHGNSLYHDVQEQAMKRLEDLYAQL